MALAPAQLARFRHGELLNRFVSDVDTLDHLYLRVISPLLGAAVVRQLQAPASLVTGNLRAGARAESPEQRRHQQQRQQHNRPEQQRQSHIE
jgi:hypothetical protein